MTGFVSKKSSEEKRIEQTEGRIPQGQRQSMVSDSQADVLVLQRAAGNRAAGQLLSLASAQRCRMAADPDIGGLTSSTTPPYTIDDVKERLSEFNLGPIRGDDVVSDLDKGGWLTFFWGKLGKQGLTKSSGKVILLSPEVGLLDNVVTLFHEGMHVLQPVKGSERDAWANLEEEINAQYQELLFIRVHASTEPELYEATLESVTFSKHQIITS